MSNLLLDGLLGLHGRLGLLVVAMVKEIIDTKSEKGREDKATTEIGPTGTNHLDGTVFTTIGLGDEETHKQANEGHKEEPEAEAKLGVDQADGGLAHLLTSGDHSHHPQQTAEQDEEGGEAGTDAELQHHVGEAKDNEDEHDHHHLLVDSGNVEDAETLLQRVGRGLAAKELGDAVGKVSQGCALKGETGKKQTDNEHAREEQLDQTACRQYGFGIHDAFY